MPRNPHLDIPNRHPGHTAHFTDYRAAEIGHVTLSPDAPVEAGSHASLVLTFTAGRFGMDDTGSLRICTRQVSDLGRPQFTNPAAANFVTASASNGAGSIPHSRAIAPSTAGSPTSRSSRHNACSSA